MRRAICLLSLRSWVRADVVYSIVQVKGIPHFGRGIHFLCALTNALQYVRGEVVVLHILKASLDHLTQVESLGAPGLLGQKIKSLLGFRSKSNRSRHVAGPPESSHYLYS